MDRLRDSWSNPSITIATHVLAFGRLWAKVAPLCTHIEPLQAAGPDLAYPP
jgi:hypothetical protein